MKPEVALWFFAGVIVFGMVNLFIATVFLRTRPRARTASSVRVLDVLALALILLVIMAAIITDVLLVIPAAPAIGRPLLYGVSALFFEVARRLFKILPITPRWLLYFLGILELLLVALAVVGVALTVVTRFI